MSQEYTSTKRIRKTRQQRNRPVLLAPGDSEQPEILARNTDTLVEEAEPVTPVVETNTATKRPLRLPNFFSKVEKSVEEPVTNDTEVVQARLARATRQKSSTSVVATDKEAEKSNEKLQKAPAKAAATANKPPKLFKGRHLIGMAVYLFAAQFILQYETLFVHNLGLDKTFLTFPFFGSQATITTSFLINILTLIVILYALVKLDLLPSSLGLTPKQVAKPGTTQSKNTQSTVVEKAAPPVMKQGVRGANDALYQSYRSNQRREKKR